MMHKTESMLMKLGLSTVVLLGLACQASERCADDTLRGSTDPALWKDASPDLKYNWCLHHKITAMAKRAERANAPHDLEQAYPAFSRDVDTCLTLVPNQHQWATPIADAVKIKMQQALGEIAADYLGQMELVRSGHGDREAAVTSWRTFAIIGIHDADTAIPEP
jgi:hypothetical protein